RPGRRAAPGDLRERRGMGAGVRTVGGARGELLGRVLASPPMLGADLAREVSPPEPYTVPPPPGTAIRYRVAAVDLGIKATTPRSMAQRGCQVRVLPATSTADEILAAGPDGGVFSNGPGDPAAAGYAVEAVRCVGDAAGPRL